MTPTDLPAWHEGFPFQARRWLRTNRATITGTALGFFAGLVTELVTDPGASSLADVFARFLPISRPLPLLTALALLALLVTWVVEAVLAHYCRNRRWEVLLARVAQARTGRSVATWSSSSITWGDCLTLQTAPDLQRGWKPGDVDVRKAPGGRALVLDSGLASRYESFRKENRDKKWYSKDGQSLRLVKNPIVFIDSPNLILEVQECRYSQVRFTNERLATVLAEQQTLLSEVVAGTLSFPHTLVLHAVVATSDAKYLATLSSTKKDYFGNTWSLSIEEQLKPSDLEGRPVSRFSRWVRRALEEELGVAAQDVDDDGVNALSVFIEAHNLNTGVCAVVHLALSSDELSAIISAKPRGDYEFVDFKFFSRDDLAAALASPVGLRFHPTSEYRMFLALVHELGPVRAARGILRS